ncbi:MAG: biotin/lipoate A/B protein ligase family protein [Candidatus Sericytochromatia bacterium]
MARERHWRLLDAPAGSGAWHMAVDEAVLEAVRQGLVPPTVRFYRWEKPTLSLGYAQRTDALDLAACDREGLEVVRRPTGGRAVLHADDFTYMIAADGLPEGVSASYRYLAGALSRALGRLGLEAQLVAGPAGQGRSPACFASATAADLCAQDRKLIGSAQVRRGGAVLQHGSLYMRYPRALADLALGEGHPAPNDLQAALGTAPTWEAIRAAFLEGFQAYFGGEWAEGPLTDWERDRALSRQESYREGAARAAEFKV